ncbi:AFR626Wp [Eremothecium gossypii ATCC 10895]|uniref:Ribokinase n=1 Tax=Eremothecium gossypii (strain ATCC 10895 / CBS 109.51 / FGSC 9923 / NRRL Y-1056) TaxID=284811 RepID=Q752F0_EREGS|nr:AFR626Wp [Eremothecium gossypii ATCC 10895]AAS53997.1 AFR626Wp [Eremothecium gossypii ATCC 10895]AEY98311.1 FAFR626Wp [Eremothecium gossypii FDAG1]
MGVTVIGSLNYDLVTYTDKVPGAGETFAGEHFETHVGGKGLNQAIAVSKLQADAGDEKVRIVGNVGRDPFGDEILEVARQNRVQVEHVGVVAGTKTGTATILVERKTGQNRIVIVSGANAKTVLEESNMEQVFPKNTSPGQHYIILQHEISDPVAYMRWLKLNRPAYQIVFNPSPFQELPADAWKDVDVLVVNEVEAFQLYMCITGSGSSKFSESEPDNMVDKFRVILSELMERGVLGKSRSGTIIVTLGEYGVLYASAASSRVLYVPAEQVVKVVDTTAAGDTFLGGLVAQLDSGSTLDDAVRFAVQASAIAVTREGASSSIPTHAEVEGKYHL